MYIMDNMRRKFVLTSILFAASASFLSGCKTSRDSRIRITYGSPIYTELVELTYSDFTQKMTNGENMIVATYNSELSPSCGCWKGFEPILERYLDEKDTFIYKMDRLEISNKNPYGIILPSDSAPTFFITNKGEIEEGKQYVYNTTSANAELFHDYDKLKDHLDSLVKEAQLMVINEEYLNKAIFEENRSDFIIYHGRNGCPDCNYCTPNFLEPYVRNNDLKNKIYMMDIEYLRGTDGYNTYKNKYKLSICYDEEHPEKAPSEMDPPLPPTNPEFGFGDGVVPTFQYWKNGVLTDMNVYFNDSYKQIDGQWTITDSYYTEERIQHLKYTDTVLLGHIIPDEEMEEKHWGEYTYMGWKQDAMAKIHNKLLGDFLDMYAK